MSRRSVSSAVSGAILLLALSARSALGQDAPAPLFTLENALSIGMASIALFPLAAHGGPLWEPMCYAQIGGLTVATFVTLLLVPVIYAFFVRDLKIVKWETVAARPAHRPAPAGVVGAAEAQPS